MGFGARNIFMFSLVDLITKQYYYQDIAGRILLGGFSFLQYAPNGWRESRVSFGRSAKYYGINRSYAVPLEFFGDGAAIIRYVLFQKRGVEQPVGLEIRKWNPENDVYEIYYIGALDLTKASNKVAESITVNVMESGIVQLLKAYENRSYQIPCDGSIPENIKVKLDGVLFNDVFRYEFVPITMETGNWAQPLVFTTNDGDNINVTHGNPMYVNANDPTPTEYAKNSGNFLFSSGQGITINLEGTLKLRPGVGDPNTEYALRWYTDKERNGFIVNLVDVTSELQVKFNVPVTLAADEKLFAIGFAGFGSVEIVEGTLNITFTSRYKTTETWALTAYDLYRLLVSEINKSGSTGQQIMDYPGESNLLQQFKNLVVCSGDALRSGNDPTYPGPIVIKTSLSEFFDSFNAVLCGALSNQQLPGKPEGLFFERRGYVFDSAVVTMNIGDVSDLAIDIATEYYWNQLSVGYPNQSYDQKAGKSEYNTTAKYGAPIKSIAKEIDLVSKYRADSYGIEYTRFNSGGKSTTHNNSDNSVFVINVDQADGSYSFYRAVGLVAALPASATNVGLQLPGTEGDYFTANEQFTQFTFVRNINMPQFTVVWNVIGTAAGSGLATFNLLRNGNVIDTLTAGPGAFIRSNQLSGLVFTQGDTLEIKYTTPGGLTVALTGSMIETTSEQIQLYPLRRRTYDSTSGIPNPDTAFNIEDLTPKRMLQRHYSWLNGVNFNLAPDSITFQTLDRNQELVTILDGIVTIENASLPISTLPSPMFYPFVFSFKTKVPVHFAEIMNGAANGHIQFSYNGIDLYGYPLEVSQKPALNEAQEWKLLCSPRTDLADLVNLDIDGINYLDMAGLSAFIPHTCPVHFVKLNFQNPSKYHTATMDQDWFKNRITRWVANNDYFNPWQNDDTIRLQCLTSGLGPVTVQLLDCHGEVAGSYELDVKSSDAVKNPYILYEGNIPLSDIPEGAYYLVLKAGTGTAIVTFVSEPIWVRESWPETILFEYSNNVNKQSTIFDTGYTPSLRVEGRIVRYEPGSHFATYENQPADIEMQNGIPYDTYKLEIGYLNGGVPDYVIRKISRIMLLTNTLIDGTGYTRNGDSKFDRTNFPGQPREFWSLDIRPSDNRDGITLSTDGTIDTNISIVYNIQATAYGSNSGVSNVFQVTEENQ